VIRVGTSGYNYPEWKGAFYPVGLPAARMLRFYAERFDTVEINYTFYRMPTPALTTRWAEATPDRFVFTLKAPGRITHQRRLADVGEPLARFLGAAAALGARLGPLFFQLPPNMPRATDRLAALLAAVPAGHRCAFEFRHASWFDADVYAVLRRHDAALCIADTEAGSTPDVTTAAWGYVRLRDAGYDDAALDRWAGTLHRPAWADAYVYFKHEASAAGPALAGRLLARLGGEARAVGDH
jgi:uncharacterized protein YecE (DUF72 family)